MRLYIRADHKNLNTYRSTSCYRQLDLMMYSYDSANTQKIKFRFQTNDHNLGYSCYSPLLTTVLTENRRHIPHDFEIGFAQQSIHYDTDAVTKPSQIRHHLIRRRETTLLRRLRHSQWLRQATQSLHKPEKNLRKESIHAHAIIVIIII